MANMPVGLNGQGLGSTAKLNMGGLQSKKAQQVYMQQNMKTGRQVPTHRSDNLSANVAVDILNMNNKRNQDYNNFDGQSVESMPYINNNSPQKISLGMIGGSLENENYQQLISNQHVRQKTNLVVEDHNNQVLKLNQNSIIGSENRISEEKSQCQDY